MALTILAAFAATRAHAEDATHGYFTATDGVKIHYVQLGNKGSHVVLIHGYLGNAQGNWFDNGIAQALAEKHRVVAIDCRNHGLSDKPQPRGWGKAEDVIEMMDHLGIKKAHFHGYSMGGGITGRLLASHPERFLTAAFGGSGIREVDPDMRERAAVLDKEGTDPGEAVVLRGLRIRSAMDNGMSREEAEKLADTPVQRPTRTTRASGTATSARRPLEIDLTKVTIPVLAINGAYDRPYSKTHRMWRELNNFTNVVLPGKSHLTAIAAPYIPKEYIESLVAFVDANDE